VENTLAPKYESDKNVRAWQKAMTGFELLASAEIVITDRLHGHIMSTVLGVPHIVMDSALGKNLDFVNTWTKGCKCARVARDLDEAMKIASRYLRGLEKMG
jgi:exopolysaccharide biosynthesis predicted pyruvyltransferase EpsI